LEPLIDINPYDLATVQRILREHLPGLEVRAFGSRVKWAARENSDLDLVVMSSEPLPALQLAELREAFSDSELPIRIDVVDWAALGASFRRVIGERSVVIHAPGDALQWPRVIIQEIAAETPNALVGGPFGSNLVSTDYENSGVPVIRGENMQGRWIGGDFVFVSPEKATELRPNTARPGDLIFTQRGTLGQVALVPSGPFDRYVISQSQMKLTPDLTKADPIFLYYVFRSPEQQQYIRGNAIQTGVPHTNLGILRKTPLTLPPLAIQRQVARVLGDLDSKIELNATMNHTLEAMARALFRSWFVDFDPVRAKMEGRPTGLPDDMAALFPNRLVETSSGEVPEGWRWSTLEAESELTMGQSPPSSAYNTMGEGLPFHQGVTNFGFRFPTHEVFTTVTERLAEDGDVLFSVRAPVGRINVANCRLVVGRGVAAIRHRQRAQSFLLYHMLNSFREEDSMGEGTIFKAVTKKDMLAIPLLAPPSGVLRAFEQIASPLDERIRLNEQQSRTLVGLRDTLLPKLISGEIRIPPFAEALA
jgi:type I restriction enzyme S subunit